MCKLDSYRRGISLFTGTAVANFMAVLALSTLAARFSNELKQTPWLYSMMNLCALIMLVLLAISVPLSIICTAQYFILRRRANIRARTRIKEMRRMGHNIKREMEFIFYAYERERDADEPDTPEMAALLQRATFNDKEPAADAAQ